MPTRSRLVEGRLSVTAGTCAVMGTASTMACIAETLGMSLPGTAAIPAVHSDRLVAAEETGKAAVRLIASRITPRRVITEKSVENAIRVLMAVGGSTNAIVHLTAIAGRLGIRISLERFNEISDETPVLVDLKPVGEGYMEDFHAAGGMGALLRELRPLLHLDTVDVEGRTLAERLDEPLGWVDRAVIRPFRRPGLAGRRAGGADAAASPRTAPSSSARPRRRRCSSPRAGRSCSPGWRTSADRIDDPRSRRDSRTTSWSCRTPARTRPGCRRRATCRSRRSWRRPASRTWSAISDARMSGTAFGSIVLHVAPEAAVGGPLAAVRNGDRIRLSIADKRIDLLVDEAEISRRLAELPAAARARARLQGALPPHGHPGPGGLRLRLPDRRARGE